MTDSPFITYACRAEHHRLQPVSSRFDTMVPMVRIALHERDEPTWRTPIGVVQPSDHLLYTVEAVRERFGAELARPIARVDLITTARAFGTRFAPIALFLGYESADARAPSFFVVEAGTADGRPKILYLGRRLDEELVYRTGYHPTPLSSADHVYRSRLTMAGPDEPGTLTVESGREVGGPPHLRITAQLERAAFDAVPVPLGMTATAAMRVMAVGRAMGADVGVVGGAIGRAGERLLPWLEAPHARSEPADCDDPAPSSRAA